jgi:cytochrome c oxidase accessory protein FixG
MRGVKDRPATAGDCIDCGACVLTCPTGIDIREGLQMECVHCTQCADACDAIMDQVDTPRGLIRYTSQAALAGAPTGLLRPRVVLYPAVLALSLGLLIFNLGTRVDTDVTLLRGIGAPFTREPNGMIINQVRVKIANRGKVAREYRVTLAEGEPIRLVAPVNPVPIRAGATVETSFFVVTPPREFEGGARTVTIRVTDGDAFHSEIAYRLQGPGGGGAP